MKIKAVMPDKAMDSETLELRRKMLSEVLSDDVELSVGCIKEGPDELDCHTDEAFAAPELIREAIKAEEEGYEAFVMYCFSDVAVDAIRENVRIPVIGPGELTLAIASLMCNRFCVITTESSNIPRTYRRLMKNCIAQTKMTSVKALDIPIHELRADKNVTQKYLLDVCRKAVTEENADGIILGCLGMAEYGDYIEANLPVKVFDPAFLSVAFAEFCVRTGVRHISDMYTPFTNKSNIKL